MELSLWIGLCGYWSSVISRLVGHLHRLLDEDDAHQRKVIANLYSTCIQYHHKLDDDDYRRFHVMIMNPFSVRNWSREGLVTLSFAILCGKWMRMMESPQNLDTGLLLLIQHSKREVITTCNTLRNGLLNDKSANRGLYH